MTLFSLFMLICSLSLRFKEQILNLFFIAHPSIFLTICPVLGRKGLEPSRALPGQLASLFERQTTTHTAAN